MSDPQPEPMEIVPCDQVHPGRSCGEYEVWLDELEAGHDRLMNERARLILDGADPAELATPISPSKWEGCS